MIFDDIRNLKKVLETIFPVENNQADAEKVSFSEIDLTSLMASLVFVQCSRYYPFDKEKFFLERKSTQRKSSGRSKR